MSAVHGIGPVAPEARTGDAGAAAPVIPPALAQRYARRAVRLTRLAGDGHPMADYLRFAASVAQAQQAVLDARPWQGDAPDPQAGAAQPLPAHALLRDPYWRDALHQLLAALAHAPLSAPARAAIEALRASPPDTLAREAALLCAGEYGALDSGRALFLWAALSLQWTQQAAQLPASGWLARGEARQFCPACGGVPVASVVLGGAQGGLRYLHCGLCETRWHLVRSKCSNCEATGRLDYWSLDSETAPIKAESCGDCHSYLKVLYLERDRELDPVADDLASLALDAEVEREGYARSGVNPFFLPGRAGTAP